MPASMVAGQVQAFSREDQGKAVENGSQKGQGGKGGLL